MRNPAIPSRSPCPRPRGGFSFVEILFAVMILAIGFIMLAAIFPVAIGQSQATREEAVGAVTARNATATVRPTLGVLAAVVPTNAPPTYMPATDVPDPAVTPVVLPFTTLSRPRVLSMHDPRIAALRNNLWNGVRAASVSTADSRAGVTFVWSRAGLVADPTLIAFPVQSRNQPTFGVDDLTEKTAGSVNYDANLCPVPVKVALTYTADGGTATVSNVTTADVAGDTYNANLPAYSDDVDAMGRAVAGAYLVISDDRTPDDWSGTPSLSVCEAGEANGRIYRLGTETARTATSATYSLDPGGAMASAAEDLPKAGVTLQPIAFIVGGRGYANPAAGDFAPVGLPMVVGTTAQAVKAVP